MPPPKLAAVLPVTRLRSRKSAPPDAMPPPTDAKLSRTTTSVRTTVLVLAKLDSPPPKSHCARPWRIVSPLIWTTTAPIG